MSTRNMEWNDPRRQRQMPGTDRGYIDPARPDLAFLRFSCSPELRAIVVQRARDEDVTLSEIIRRALRAYLRPSQPSFDVGPPRPILDARARSTRTHDL